MAENQPAKKKKKKKKGDAVALCDPIRKVGAVIFLWCRDQFLLRAIFEIQRRDHKTQQNTQQQYTTAQQQQHNTTQEQGEHTTKMSKQQKVLVIGSGMAGLACAKRLSAIAPATAITIVDKVRALLATRREERKKALQPHKPCTKPAQTLAHALCTKQTKLCLPTSHQQ